VRSLPFPRRLQLVKLLRAHGVKDVERLREDELRDALARLSILLPDLAAEAPFAALPASPSSTIHAADGDADTIVDTDTAAIDAIDEDADDPHCLPRFREPKVSLPEAQHTFARAICVKPGEMFVSWQLRDDVVVGDVALEVFAVEYFGRSPDAAAVLATTPRLVVDVDRASHGWYVHIPQERWAVVVNVVVASDEGRVVVATSNLALATPAKRSAAGPLWLASIGPEVDRRVLREHGGVFSPTPHVGVELIVAGTIDDDGTHHADDHSGVGRAGLHLSSSTASTGSTWSASRPSSSTSSTLSRGKERP